MPIFVGVRDAKRSNKEGKMKKKNKWYEVLGAGLLSVMVMYLCTALVITSNFVDG